MAPGDILACFNPTLVRLRRHQEPGRDHPSLMFQSHAGSIEAAPIAGPMRPAWEFQSHAGSIEAMISASVILHLLMFQSHAGSIEAAQPNSRAIATASWFQSHAGSIEALLAAAWEATEG